MPVIRSAKKQMKQNLKHRARNYPYRSELKSTVKKGLLLVKEGKLEEANKFIAHAYSVIDTACKKNIIHQNNAARKKSRLAVALNSLQKGGGTVAVAPAAPAAKKAKVEAKVEADIESAV